MAITNGATVGQQGMGSTVRMSNQARVKLDLDASYPAGGYPSFVATTIKGILGSKITVLDIQQAGPILKAAAYYSAHWDRENDKLVLETGGAVATGDLSTITAIEFIVTYI